MPWTIEYNDALEMVVVTTEGEWDSEQDTLMLGDLKIQSDAHDCLRLLIDHRGCRIRFGLMSMYDRVPVYQRLQFSKHTKAALVMTVVIDNTLFYENLCVNRGFNVKVFDDYDRAVEWLVS